jgi:hypothetical protein
MDVENECEIKLNGRGKTRGRSHNNPTIKIPPRTFKTKITSPALRENTEVL